MEGRVVQVGETSALQISPPSCQKDLLNSLPPPQLPAIPAPHLGWKSEGRWLQHSSVATAEGELYLSRIGRSDTHSSAPPSTEQILLTSVNA